MTALGQPMTTFLPDPQGKPRERTAGGGSRTARPEAGMGSAPITHLGPRSGASTMEGAFPNDCFGDQEGEGVTALRQPMKVPRQPVKVLRHRVKVLRQPVKVLRQPVKVLRHRVKVLRQPMKVLRHRVKVLRRRLHGNEPSMAPFRHFPPLSNPHHQQKQTNKCQLR